MPKRPEALPDSAQGPAAAAGGLRLLKSAASSARQWRYARSGPPQRRIRSVRLRGSSHLRRGQLRTSARIALIVMLAFGLFESTASAHKLSMRGAQRVAKARAYDAYLHDGWGRLLGGATADDWIVADPSDCVRMSRHKVTCPYWLVIYDNHGDEMQCMDFIDVWYPRRDSILPRSRDYYRYGCVYA